MTVNALALLILAMPSIVGAADETFTSIDFPGADSTSALAINPSGDIVGDYVSDGVGHGFLLSGDEFMSIDFPGASFSEAWRINSRGDIVGRYISSGMSHGYLLRPGRFTTIDFPHATSTIATGINPGGDIVGRYDSPDQRTHGWLLSKGERHDDD